MRPALVKRPNRTHAAGWLLAAALSVTGSVAWAQVTVSLNAPANGATYVPPVNITLSASASASQGYTVSKVEFFYGTTLIGTDTSSPYSITWNNAPSGQHVLTAKATAIKKNSPDQTATSTAANITVNALPVVSFTAPPLYFTVNMPPPPIAVSASASDSDGTISKVEFWETQCSLTSTPGLLATVTTPPYGFTWNISPPYHADGKPQARCILAIATDNLGAQATDFTAVLLDPTIALSSPINGATYSAPASIPLTIAVTPSDWPIEKVQFYSGTTLIGETFTAPYSFTWGNVPVGSYSLTAKMISSTQGHESTSAPVNITVNAAAAQLHFVHVDHLNTPRLVASQQGQTVWRWDQQEPFGVSVPDENPSGLGAFEFPLRFPGQYADKETNLHYNYFRDYDPSIGRYGESDPIGLVGGINTYTYVRSSPLVFSDSTGLQAIGMVLNPIVWGPPLVIAAAWMMRNPQAVQSISNALSGAGDDPPSNVIPFPTTKPPEVCKPDDPCEKERVRLEGNKTFVTGILTSIKNPARAAQQYNVAAIFLNRDINLHNALCPHHQVDRLPMMPMGPTGIVK